MISHAHLSRPARLVVRLLWAAGLTGLALFALAAGLPWGDAQSAGFHALYVGLVLVAGTLCILRAALIGREREVWALFGIGMTSWGPATSGTSWRWSS